MSPATYGTGVEGGYAPADLRSAYRLPSSTAGSGQTVAVVDAFDDPNAEVDLSVYRSQYGLGECTALNGCFRKVSQTGGNTMPSPNRTWAQEISLDLDMVSAICPNCKILLVEASNEQAANLATAENEAAALHATEISNSYEEPESPAQAPAYDHSGIPIAVAGGDRGYGVVSPAANPHVIAVGGTTLVPVEGRRRWAETVWHTAGAGTGSGCSQEPKPAWQSDPGCAGRTANDIAAVADPNTPVSAYDSYETPHSWLLLGGTSVSSPILAAAMALSTPYTRSFDGAQALYLEVENGGAFNDVVAGANGNCGTYLCEAGPGYDGPSGLGTLSGTPEVPPPSPATDNASSVSRSEATLAGSVNPHGVRLSECGFQYGPTLAYGSYAPCSELPGVGFGAVRVSAVVAGLALGAAFHFRLHVTYAGGSGDGADVSFATPGFAPVVYPGEPSNVTSSSANVNARVNPSGAAVTSCSFEYGAAASYGLRVPCSSLPGGGQTPVSVSATLSGLSANSTYHYRVVASNTNGTTYGSDQTVALPPPPPIAMTRAPTAIGRTSARLNATVNANGGSLTTCAFEFNSAETLVPCSTTPRPLAGAVSVSALVARLRSGSRFRYRIIAASAGGTTYGALAEFSSLPSAAQLAARYAARLASTSLAVSSNGKVRMRVRCPGHRARCRGTITLRTRARLAGGKTAVIASGSFAVAPGATSDVRLQLSRFARTALRRPATVRASATVRTVGAGGSVGVWHAAVSLTRRA